MTRQTQELEKIIRQSEQTNISLRKKLDKRNDEVTAAKRQIKATPTLTRSSISNPKLEIQQKTSSATHVQTEVYEDKENAARIESLNKDLLYYKSTSKDLRKKLKELVLINNKLAQVMQASDEGVGLAKVDIKIGKNQISSQA